MSEDASRITVCRCEDVTLADIRKAIAEGARTIEEIKKITRAGMGPCQGKSCRLLIASELAKALGKPMSEVLPPKFRPPAKPVSLGELADMEAEEVSHK